MVFLGPDLPRAAQLGMVTEGCWKLGLKPALSKEGILEFDVPTPGKKKWPLAAPVVPGALFEGLPCVFWQVCRNPQLGVFAFVFVSRFFHDSSNSERLTLGRAVVIEKDFLIPPVSGAEKFSGHNTL